MEFLKRYGKNTTATGDAKTKTKIHSMVLTEKSNLKKKMQIPSMNNARPYIFIDQTSKRQTI